jgi:hypothetical protein
MRVSDARFEKDLRRYQLAWRMIRHEVRTGLIQIWTGLSSSRVRTLYQTYAQGEGASELPRHRGVSPTNLEYFTRSSAHRREAAIFGGICRAMRLLSAERVLNASVTFPSLSRGELLCAAFETYCLLVPDPRFSLERAMGLVIAFAQADELTLTQCVKCQAIILVDLLGEPRDECHVCRHLIDQAPSASAGQATLF